MQVDDRAEVTTTQAMLGEASVQNDSGDSGGLASQRGGFTLP